MFQETIALDILSNAVITSGATGFLIRDPWDVGIFPSAGIAGIGIVEHNIKMAVDSLDKDKKYIFYGDWGSDTVKRIAKERGLNFAIRKWNEFTCEFVETFNTEKGK